MNKIKKYISVILVICLLCNLYKINNIYASDEKIQSVYVDGIEYNYYIQNNGDIIIKTAETKEYFAEMIIHNDGQNADATIRNKGKEENYEIAINELTAENIDVSVITDGVVVEKFNSIDDIYEEEYECQTTATVTVTVFSIATLLEVILEVAAFVTIAGVTYYSLSKAYEAIKEDSKKKKFIYKATLAKSGVYIDKYNPIDTKAAVARMRLGYSIYTYSGVLAQNITFNTGLGCIEESEIDSKMVKGNVYYYHWHTANRNGSHAWFGRPHTK